jgi:hypothetical protein
VPYEIEDQVSHSRPPDEGDPALAQQFTRMGFDPDRLFADELKTLLADC